MQEGVFQQNFGGSRQSPIRRQRPEAVIRSSVEGTAADWTVPTVRFWLKHMDCRLSFRKFDFVASRTFVADREEYADAESCGSFMLSGVSVPYFPKVTVGKVVQYQ